MLVGKRGNRAKRLVCDKESPPPNDDMGDNGAADARHCKRYATTSIPLIP